MKKIWFISIALMIAFHMSGCSRSVSVTSKTKGPCPPDMVNVNGKVCIDRYEYPNKLNEYPVVNVDWSQATKLCKSEGKRLCSSNEWIYACQSGKGYKFPYGNSMKDYCNVSMDYMKNTRDVIFTPMQVQDSLHILNQTDMSSYSQTNKELLTAVGYFLTLQLRLINASNALVSVKNGGKAIKNKETIIRSLLFTPEEYNSISAEIRFLIRQKQTSEDPLKLESLSINDYKSILESLIHLEEAEISSHSDADKQQNRNLQKLYEQDRAHIIAVLISEAPGNLSKICSTHFEVLQAALDNYSNEIYENKLKDIPYDDLKQINEKIVPAIDVDQKGIFNDLLYALERKIAIEYDQPKASLKISRTQFVSGQNAKCISRQGVMDLVGNVYEWTGTTNNDAVYRGGDSTEGSEIDFKLCSPTFFSNTKIGSIHAHFPDVGFRCCK